MNVMLAFVGWYFVHGQGHVLYMCSVVSDACHLVQ